MHTKQKLALKLENKVTNTKFNIFESKFLLTSNQLIAMNAIKNVQQKQSSEDIEVSRFKKCKQIIQMREKYIYKTFECHKKHSCTCT